MRKIVSEKVIKYVKEIEEYRDGQTLQERERERERACGRKRELIDWISGKL